ncbi:hypothetical protein WJX84_012006 [Apatococcus fuscideae]|uniref:Uncharacterized protein n=1 Tax=Apatococcus fuscideae TaxID=2026836 RepID=A0AAW1T7S2_9CHLO
MGRPAHCEWWLRYWMWDRMDVMHGDGVVVYGEHPAAALLALTERGLATTPVRHLLRCACALHRASTAETERRESRLQDVPVYTDALAGHAWDDGLYYVLDLPCVSGLPDPDPDDLCPVASP